MIILLGAGGAAGYWGLWRVEGLRGAVRSNPLQSAALRSSSPTVDTVSTPAAPLAAEPKLTTDAEGYLVAAQDFQEPVGPSFWERG